MEAITDKLYIENGTNKKKQQLIFISIVHFRHILKNAGLL